MLYDKITTPIKLLTFLLALVLLCSCVNTRRATYFNNLQNVDLPDQDIEPVIQKNNILSIVVSSLNPEATTIFNTPNMSVISSTNGTGTSSVTTGYLVDRDGGIVFPVLGYIKVAGMTFQQLTDYLQKTIKEKQLLVDPIVSLRILNFKVTVLGEVNRPGVLMVPEGKISLLEAIGEAGDLTLFAKRDNVLLIRVENGKKITRRVDLNAQDFVFNSPYYYLKANDVLYVEPNKTKIGGTSNLQQILPLAFSGLSLIIIVLSTFIKHP